MWGWVLGVQGSHRVTGGGPLLMNSQGGVRKKKAGFLSRHHNGQIPINVVKLPSDNGKCMI